MLQECAAAMSLDLWHHKADGRPIHSTSSTSQSLLIDGRRAGEDLPPFIAESDIPIFKKVVNQTMLITAFGVQSD